MLGILGPNVREIFSDGVAAADDASSRSMGVEAMIIVRRVPGMLNWRVIEGGSHEVHGRSSSKQARDNMSGRF